MIDDKTKYWLGDREVSKEEYDEFCDGVREKYSLMKPKIDALEAYRKTNPLDAYYLALEIEYRRMRHNYIIFKQELDRINDRMTKVIYDQEFDEYWLLCEQRNKLMKELDLEKKPE